MLSVDQEAAVRATGLALNDLAAADTDLLKELYQELGLTAKQKILVHSAIKTFLGTASKPAQEANKLTVSPPETFPSAALSPLRLLPLLSAQSSEAPSPAPSLEKHTLQTTTPNCFVPSPPLPPPPPSKPPSPPKPPPLERAIEPLAHEFSSSSNGKNAEFLPKRDASPPSSPTFNVRPPPETSLKTMMEHNTLPEDAKIQEEKNWRDAHGILPSLVDSDEPAFTLRKSPRVRSNRKNSEENENSKRFADEMGAHFPQDGSEKTFESNAVNKITPPGENNVLAKLNKIYVCDLCKVKCVSAGAAATHANTKRHLTNTAVANAQVAQNGKNIWECSVCQHQSETSDALRKHLNSQHKDTFGDGVSHKKKPIQLTETVIQRETRRTFKGSEATDDNRRRSSREWQPSQLSLQIIANKTHSIKQASPTKPPSPPQVSKAEKRGRSTRVANRRNVKRRAASGKESEESNKTPRPFRRSLPTRSALASEPEESGNSQTMTELIRGLENYIQTQGGEVQA